MIRNVIFISTILASAVTLHAQLIESNSITLTIYRSVSVPVSQVTFSGSLSGDANTDPASVAAMLTKAGLPPVTITGSSFDLLPGEEGRYSWSFSYDAPASRIKENLAILTSASRKLQLGFSLTSTPPSASMIDDTRQQLVPGMILDARSQAAKIASAAGLSLGNLLGITDSPVYGGYLGSRNPSGPGFGGSFPSTYPINYGISVKFALLR